MTAILHKRNSTPGLPPSPPSLSAGEIAINIADGNLFTKTANGSIKTFLNSDNDPFVLNKSLSSIKAQNGGNSVTGLFAGALGGYNNNVGGSGSSILNGESNQISGDYAGIVGGLNNVIGLQGDYSAILGGKNNTLNHTESFILGSNITSHFSGFTYVNNLSATNKIYGDGSELAGVVGTDTKVRELTANWQNTYTTVQTSSANWDSVYNNSFNFALTSDSRFTDSRTPTGIAGGDLSGSYPNPTIKNSVALYGQPTAPTAAAGTNTNQIATTQFVQNNRGDTYFTTSTSTNTIDNGGGKTFVVASSSLSYTPTQDVTITWDGDPLNYHMHCTVVSFSGYDLVVDVNSHSGNGTHSNWTINVGGFTTQAGALLQSNNLSDVASASTSLTNLGGVSTTRIISAGIGLIGGGDLTTDRTISIVFGNTSGTAVSGNDPRLSDARTPTAHKSTHAIGGADFLSPSDIGALDTTVYQQASGNWQSTFTTVQTNSANWGLVTISDPLKFKFIANGVTKNFSVSGTNDSTNASYIDVYIENVKQEPEFSYTLSADTVKFIEFPESGSEIVVITPNTKFVNLQNNAYNIPTFVNSGTSGISQELTDKINNTSTLVQANSALWAAGAVISKTYAELKALKQSSSLVPGQYYKITDFQTMWWNQVIYSSPASVVLTSPIVEPLNILAIATNKFSPVAYSDLYPADIIYYNFEATQNDNMLYATGIANFKGWITRRTDTIKNIDIPIDWRHVTANCCRPNLSSIPQWNSSTTYSLWDVVKINNKLYYSTSNGNANNNPVPDPAYINMPTVYWRPISGYREGLTYFPTDENFGFYAYKPDGSYLVNVPANTATRIQKYMFGTDPESGNSSNDLTNYYNIEVEGAGCFSNIFCGTSNNLKFGGEFYFNLLREMDTVTARSKFRFNVLDANYNNDFGNQAEHNRSTRDISHGSFSFSNNVFVNETHGNIFLGGTDGNVFGAITKYNHFGPTTKGNTIGNSCYNNFFPFHQVRYNTLASFFHNNFIDTNSSFEGNVTLGSCYDNIFGGSSLNNLIGTNFRNNNIGNSFTNNKIGADFFLNNIGHTFSYNDIGEYNNNSTIGNYFRRNTVKTAGIVGQNFTSSTLVYNEFDKTIFTNQSGQYKLSYYNASDVLVITSPTA